MHYLILLAIALVTLLLCAGVLLVSKKRNLAKPIIIGLILIIVTQGAALLWQFRGNSRSGSSSSTIQEDARKIAPKVAATVYLPAYEVLSKKDVDANTTRVTIYTLEKNSQKLVALNKKLKDEYTLKSTDGQNNFILYIDYFDDKTVAGNYFTLINDSKTTAAQKRKLLSHYIAMSSPSFKTPENLLMLGNQNQIIEQLSAPKENK